ncbi:hypothetical protein ACFFRR_008583 [Megaselia abdita]
MERADIRCAFCSNIIKSSNEDVISNLNIHKDCLIPFLKKNEEDKVKLLDLIVGLNAQLTEKANEIENWNSGKSPLHAQLENLEIFKKEKDNKLIKLKESKKELENKLGSSEEEIRQLKYINERDSLEITLLNKKLEEKSMEIANWNSEKNEVTKQANLLENKLGSSEEEIRQLKYKNERDSLEITLLNKKLEEKSMEIAILNSEKNEVTKQANLLEHKLGSSEKEIRQLKSQNERDSLEITLLNKKLEEKSMEIANLNSEKNEVTKQANLLEHKLGSSEKEIRQLKSQNERDSLEITLLNKKLEEKSMEIANLNSEKNEVTKQANGKSEFISKTKELVLTFNKMVKDLEENYQQSPNSIKPEETVESGVKRKNVDSLSDSKKKTRRENLQPRISHVDWKGLSDTIIKNKGKESEKEKQAYIEGIKRFLEISEDKKKILSHELQEHLEIRVLKYDFNPKITSEMFLKICSTVKVHNFKGKPTFTWIIKNPRSYDRELLSKIGFEYRTRQNNFISKRKFECEKKAEAELSSLKMDLVIASIICEAMQYNKSVSGENLSWKSLLDDVQKEKVDFLEKTNINSEKENQKNI